MKPVFKVIIGIFILTAITAVAAFRSKSVLVISNEPTLSSSSTPTPTTDRSISLLFVGDMMLSRSVGNYMTLHDDWIWPFRLVASASSRADLTFGNLETTISNRGAQNGCGFCFRSDPRVIQGLLYAGFDVVSVANNHMWDYGQQALTDTLSFLKAAGIDPVGGGRTEAEAAAGVVRDVRGTKIGYLAYTDILPASAYAGVDKVGVAKWDLQQMKTDIEAMRRRADVVVVSFHTGTEYMLTHNSTQQSIYTSAIDDGADLVIGSHPHVVQELLPYKNGWIAYSLGNFVFDQNFSTETMSGLAMNAIIQNKKIVRVTPIRVGISALYQPAFR